MAFKVIVSILFLFIMSSLNFKSAVQQSFLEERSWPHNSKYEYYKWHFLINYPDTQQACSFLLFQYKKYIIIHKAFKVGHISFQNILFLLKN